LYETKCAKGPRVVINELEAAHEPIRHVIRSKAAGVEQHGSAENHKGSLSRAEKITAFRVVIRQFRFVGE
jgi:hypothetical protein